MARINDEVFVREGIDPFSIQNQKEEDAKSLSEGGKSYPPRPAKFESVNYLRILREQKEQELESAVKRLEERQKNAASSAIKGSQQ